MKTTLPLILLGALLAGCWTFNETPYPEVRTSEAGAGAPTLALTGFESLVTEWATLHGYQTVYAPAPYGRRHLGPSHFATVPTVEFLPQQRVSDAFLRRAQDTLEKAGYVLRPADAALTADVRFAGPFCNTADAWTKFAWNVGTVFFCDYAAMRWTAQLRVRDTHSGRLVFHRDYEQTYETNVFGLIPLLGAPSCEKTEPGVQQVWCLSALTDRISADLSAYLNTRAAPSAAAQ